jgi:cell wall-associated NlpC family hydrolase
MNTYQVHHEDIVEKATRMVGTPFVHQGRLPGVGVDCIGLLVCAAREAGLDVGDRASYGRQPNPRALMAELDRVATRLSRPIDARALGRDDGATAFARRGAVLVFWRVRTSLPRHVGVCDGEFVVHTWQEIGRVVRHRIDGSEWSGCLHSVWWLKGVA